MIRAASKMAAFFWEEIGKQKDKIALRNDSIKTALCEFSQGADFVVFSFFYHFSSSNLSMLTSLTQSTNNSVASAISSGVGKDGAIRILLSFGSFP